VSLCLPCQPASGYGTLPHVDDCRCRTALAPILAMEQTATAEVTPGGKPADSIGLIERHPLVS
jgi:hypothetical protein